MILIIISALTVCTIIYVKLNYDLYHTINHAKEWRYMALASLIPIALLTISTNLKWYLAAPLSAAMVSTFIWFFFDGLFNKFRGYNWWFTGTEGYKGKANSDNFLQQFDRPAQILIKTLALVAPIVIYLFTYQ